MTKRQGAISDNGFIFKKINQNQNIKEEKNPASRFGNYPIYPVLSTWISTWTEPEALYELSLLRTILYHFK